MYVLEGKRASGLLDDRPWTSTISKDLKMRYWLTLTKNMFKSFTRKEKRMLCQTVNEEGYFKY